MAKGKYQEWLTDEGLTVLKGWACDGLLDTQIAKNIGISRETYYKWIKQYSDFADAIKKGREVCDYEVQNELYQSAIGYDVTETRIEEMTDATGGTITKKITTTKHIPGNTTAQIFWLKNRKPDDWKDKREETIHTEDNRIKVCIQDSMADYAD